MRVTLSAQQFSFVAVISLLLLIASLRLMLMSSKAVCACFKKGRSAEYKISLHHKGDANVVGFHYSMLGARFFSHMAAR
jgi:hypothetical protein